MNDLAHVNSAFARALALEERNMAAHQEIYRDGGNVDQLTRLTEEWERIQSFKAATLATRDRAEQPGEWKPDHLILQEGP